MRPEGGGGEGGAEGRGYLRAEGCHHGDYLRRPRRLVYVGGGDVGGDLAIEVGRLRSQ